jgi:hypothetical protein
MRHLPLRDRGGLLVAAVTAALCLLTIASPDWSGGSAGFGPNQHRGWAEWPIVAVLAVICIVCTTRVRNPLWVTPALDRHR